MNDQKIRLFISWVSKNLAGYRTEPADSVAEAIADEIVKVEKRLGVEVPEDSEDPRREVIVTTYSDPTLFPLVRRIVGLLADVPGWRFVALKPPRGFEFTLTFGDRIMQAERLEFRAIPSIAGGIQVLLPTELFMGLPLGEEAEELSWLIVETGIGEELASKLKHIEFSSLEYVKDKHPITDLYRFLMNNP